MVNIFDDRDGSRGSNHNNRLSFSTWLKPITSQSSYGSLWSAVKELQSIHANRTLSSSDSPTHLESHGFSQIDPWERSFVLNWLTRLLSFTMHQISTARDHDDWESLSSLVAQVMAQMTESPATPSQCFSRRWLFDLSLEGICTDELDHHNLDRRIEIELKEGSLSYSAIGFQTWNSAPLLCRRLVRNPAEFFPQLVPRLKQHLIYPPLTPNLSRRSLKVLELGSGTGLVGLTASHVLASILSTLGSLQPVDVEVILTDYHPEVLTNLRHNVEHNKIRLSLPDSCQSTLIVKVMRLDWREPGTSELVDAGLTGAFDVILGSDLVYEPEHALWASNAVRYFLKRESIKLKVLQHPNVEDPSITSTAFLNDKGGCSIVLTPSFHLLLPLRPTFIKESEAVHAVFGGSDLNLLLDQTDKLTYPLPTHSCKWELSTTPKVEETIQAADSSRSLKIMQYCKEEGVKFGQGCSEYQYLLIQWSGSYSDD